MAILHHRDTSSAEPLARRRGSALWIVGHERDMNETPPNEGRLADLARLLASVSWLFLFLGLLLPTSPAPSWAMFLCTYGVSLCSIAGTLMVHSACERAGQSVSRGPFLAAVTATVFWFLSMFARGVN